MSLQERGRREWGGCGEGEGEVHVVKISMFRWVRVATIEGRNFSYYTRRNLVALVEEKPRNAI